MKKSCEKYLEEASKLFHPFNTVCSLLSALIMEPFQTEMKDHRQCCGFGGKFALKYGNNSGAIVDDKCKNIRDFGAEAMVLGDLGCMLNIEGRLRRTGDNTTRVLHVAQILAGDA